MERSEQPIDDLTGITLAERFLITGRLGQGGMGSIYTAHDSVLSRDVAIKTIARTNLNDNELMRFQREAKAASTLRHPNVIQMLDFGVTDSGQPYMVMELIKGISLAELIDERGPQSPFFVLQIIEQVAEGMSDVHKSGIIHRDLKTGNIMLLQAGMQTNQPLIKILDFGIAKSLGQDEQVKTITKAGQIFGSPNSMSPEQARGDKLDQRSDIYSLGCIAFELLTGRPIFEGDSVMEVLTKHLNEPPSRLWEVSDKKFPMELERLVAHMVLKDPDERYQTMQELIKNVREVYPVVSAEDYDASILKRSQPALEEADSAPPANRRLNARALFAAVSVCVILLVAAVGYIYSWINDKQTPVKPKPPEVVLEREIEQLDLIHGINADLEDLAAFNHSGRVTPRLEKLIKAGKNIQDLIFFDSEVVDSDAQLIAKLHPSAINLTGCTGVSPKFLKGLSEIPSIQMLSLDRVKGMTPSSLAQLSKLPRFQMLKAMNCDLTDEHLRAIGGIKSLRVLQISQNKRVTPAGLQFVGGKKEIVQVLVNQPAITLLADYEMKRLRNKYKIIVLKQDTVPEDISPKAMGQIGGRAMDEIFGPIGGGPRESSGNSKDSLFNMLP